MPRKILVIGDKDTERNEFTHALNHPVFEDNYRFSFYSLDECMQNIGASQSGGKMPEAYDAAIFDGTSSLGKILAPSYIHYDLKRQGIEYGLFIIRDATVPNIALPEESYALLSGTSAEEIKCNLDKLFTDEANEEVIRQWTQNTERTSVTA